MDTKLCYMCKKHKLFSEFNKYFMGKYGLSSKCKQCTNIMLAEYYIKNKDKIHKRFATPVICPECLGSYKKSNKSNHMKTKKHINNKDKLNQINFI